MAVAPTGNIFKALSFDNVSSRTYGVYITGEAVYNAPERDVEMVEIPGRNGAFALDKGRFQNIEVTYPAGIFADNETDFAEAISDFRNFLCSRNGYVRLSDEYNPNEYRMAIYKSGLEVTPAQLKAGEFEIVFDCKPQRFLTSGETAVTVANNGKLTNPTLFESSPMLEVEGYGTVEFNGYEIEITNEVFGEVKLTSNKSMPFSSSATEIVEFDPNLVNIGDNFSINEFLGSAGYGTGRMEAYFRGDPSATWGAATLTSTNVIAGSDRAGGTYADGVFWERISFSLPSANFTVGTASTLTSSVVASMTTHLNGNDGQGELSCVASIAYDGGHKLTYTATATIMTDTLNVFSFSGSESKSQLYIRQAKADSTATILGHPTYIDCDLGEAYMIKDGSVISLNQYIDLGSNLPILATGANEITFDNTVTDLKIIPRWWKV